jgi:soluble lytic murein transglycosylase
MKKLNYKLQTITVFLLLSPAIWAQTYNDSTLANVRQKDAVSRDATGKVRTLAASEHIYRGDVYMSNRAFPEAREHYLEIIANYPNESSLIPRALFGMGRSFMWEKQYVLAVKYFADLTKDYLNTKEGREGLAFTGACLIRMNKSAEAAKVYEQYTVMFPTGERIESSYLNVTDALREAGKYEEAALWVDKIRQRFPNTATETNAEFARLRMEIGRKKWNAALKSTDQLRLLRYPKGVMTSFDEVGFLRGFVLEKLGRRDEAIAAYLAVPDKLTSYYGAAATDRLQNVVKENDLRHASLQQRKANVSTAALRAASDYPLLFRDDLIKESVSRSVDPRFVLAIMKQESSFRANAKSQAAARGLLQMTVDTAAKYTVQANISRLQPEDLYRPSVNIALGSVYLADLQKEFPGLPEAVAASYNGGEDNAARWQKRADSKEAFLFTSEVGFAETKDYVFKVMANYRAYCELYTQDLKRK